MLQVNQNFRADEVELPQLLIKQSAVEHNLAAMQRYCDARGVAIAPHAKTSMSPWVIRRQLEAHGWGVTVATLAQLRVCLELGAPRVILANEVASSTSAEMLGHIVDEHRGQKVYVLVDSEEGVAALGEGLGRLSSPEPLRVLVEVGAGGGRAGCRSLEAVLAVGDAIAKEPLLQLVGVEGFEGILGSARTPEELRRVDEFLEGMGRAAEALARAELFAEGEEIILSAGGSMFFDRVAELLPKAGVGERARVVIRSGCYVTHDHGHLVRPMASEPAGGLFVPALELWGEVLSTPEPGRAIAGFGKRDAPFDAGMPVVIGSLRRGEREVRDPGGATITALNDQHAYVKVSDGAPLLPGDRLVCGVVHPCTAFDKWRQIAIVDDDYTVIDVADTYF